MNKRLDELRGKFQNKRGTLSIGDLVKMESGKTETPVWKRILDNSHMMQNSRDDKKRLHLPTPESDVVVKFLDDIKSLVDALVTVDNFEKDIDVEFDGGQGDSMKRELKHEVISVLQGCIHNRGLLKGFSLNERESILNGFDTIQDLYDFLEEVSGRSKQEIKDFILDEIPSAYWENNFGESIKAA